MISSSFTGHLLFKSLRFKFFKKFLEKPHSFFRLRCGRVSYTTCNIFIYFYLWQNQRISLETKCFKIRVDSPINPINSSKTHTDLERKISRDNQRNRQYSNQHVNCLVNRSIFKNHTLATLSAISPINHPVTSSTSSYITEAEK